MLNSNSSLLPEYRQSSLFDYTSLDTETRIVVQQRTDEIKALMRRTAQDIIDIGNKLIDVKARLGHGNFINWLNAEFGWHRDTANKFIHVATRFSSSEMSKISTFAPSALYLLSAPSTPDEARTEAIERAEAGEPITHKAAQEIVASYRRPDPAPIAPPPVSPALWLPPEWVNDDVEDAKELDPQPIVIIPDEPMGRQKPKINRGEADEYKPQGFDACQTPAYAVDPIFPYLKPEWTIWEPARGEGNIVKALYDGGFKSVLSSDMLTGQNFFDYEPDSEWDCLVTNPPYSLKYRWLERCYALGKPFALLLPVETLGAKTAQVMFRNIGLEIIFLDRRVNFKMPNIGWDGSAAQFPTAWFTWGLNLGQQMIFAEVARND